MVSRHLILKLYLWLLLALTLSVLAAAGAFAVLSPADLEERARQWFGREFGGIRDMTEQLLSSGLSQEQIRAVLEPLAKPHHGQVAVIAADGSVALSVGGADHGQAAIEALAPAERDTVLAGDMVFHWGERPVVALPATLPDGTRGMFVATFRESQWGGHAPPWRVLAGIATVLVTLWLLSWPLAAHLARPLQRMAKAADALGSGDLRVRIAPKDVQHRWHRHPRRDEIGRLAESFNTMAGNLERLVMSHKQLLGDISHELRSPLARLRLALELVRRTEGEEQAEYLGSLERQADAMEGLISELLIYARLEEAPDRIQPEPVATLELMDGLVQTLTPDAEARGVRVEHTIAADAATVVGERRLLERALANVLRNAIAYSPEQGTVTIAVLRVGERIEITVTDQGDGVPDAQRERIFEPFVRTDTARSRETGGAGLGLAIVRRCMEAHGGGARAAPGPNGRGLAVTLWLPSKQDGPAEDTAENTAENTADRSGDQRS